MPDGEVAIGVAHDLIGRNVAARGDAVAVVDDTGWWTVAELWEAGGRAADGLEALGVRAGDRVGVALPDGREAAAALVGAMRIGAIAVPLDPGWSREATAAVVDDCEPAVVVDRPGTLDRGVPRPVSPVRASGRRGDDPALIVSTSGSTGRPKGVVHTRAGLAPEGPNWLRDGLGAGPGDRVLAVARTATALGCFIGLLRPLGSGAAAVLTARRPTPRGTLELVARTGVTVLAAVPMHWAQIAAALRHSPGLADNLAGLRAAVSSGDRLPAGLRAELARHGVRLIDALGASECGDVYLWGDGDDVLDRVAPGVDVRLDGGAEGRILVRTPRAAAGYWRRPGLTARLRDGGWTRTEDVAARDAAGGGLRLLGRADDLFKVGGRLVSPAEIEGALADHPMVAEAAVVGRAHRGGRIRPAAFVVPAPTAVTGGRGDGVLARELRRHVSRRLTPALAPARVDVLDALPRLAGGKLDRRALAAAAAA
ncbi:MAG TPA: AMP-binding protein [Miltoncostaeaceae bacterium]|nr:AMP-binding protein [Miltoncostaeaceae bacterium]